MAPAIAAISRPAKAAQHFQRIFQMRTVQGNCGIDGINLALKHFSGRTSAGTNPIFRRTAIKAMENGGSGSGVADAHFADAQKICATGDGFHAECHGRRAGLFIQSCFFGDVGSWIIERQIEYLEAKIGWRCRSG